MAVKIHCDQCNEVCVEHPWTLGAPTPQADQPYQFCGKDCLVGWIVKYPNIGHPELELGVARLLSAQMSYDRTRQKELEVTWLAYAHGS